MAAQLISLNVGSIREVDHDGRTVTTGIFKSPTEETLRIAGTNVGPDQQADLDAHGGPDKAIYAYADEDYRWWATELDQPMHAGLFGENLTTIGVDVSNARIGDRWRIGTAELEVSEPRLPCYKLGIRTEIPRIQQRFTKANRPGTYLRIVTEGDVASGDEITVEPAGTTSVTVADIARIYHQRSSDRDPVALAALLEVPGLSDPWLAWVRRTLDTKD